jgi:sucrose phosphorylase
MINQVQLITYVDRFGRGGFPDLNQLLQGPLAGIFGGVHLLPFFNAIDGADAGFDPIDHTQVDHRLGRWKDVAALSETAELMADLIVNHMSSESPQFRDFSEKGSASPHAPLFLTLDRVFPQGTNEAELLRIYRPRPGLPFHVATLKTGEKRVLWTTFTPQQIDIDVSSSQGEAYLKSILHTFKENGIRAVRLDAAGYAIKKAGTSCFMIPETYEFIGRLTKQARALGIEVLVEIHSYFQQQIEIAKKVDLVYDFALPPLVLHTLFKNNAAPLKRWLAISPRNALTVLDTHDGIGVIDVGADPTDPVARPGLLPPPAIDELVETIHRNSNGESRQATGAAASNLDLYQVNCTYFDALGRNENDYLIARAIQFFAPGTPQVYYVGLLAGCNDLDLLSRTHVGRDINRHYYSAEEVQTALARPLVGDLLELIRFRNRHPAFNGTFAVLDTPDHVLALEWRNSAEFARLEIDLELHSAHLRFTENGQEHSRALKPSINQSPSPKTTPAAKSIVCFGEILWDVLPQGNHLGGAPYNVAYHITHLGCAARLVSAVGEDVLGGTALAAAEHAGITTDAVARLPHLPTGTVLASIDHQGQPSYQIAESVAWDQILTEPAINENPPDAVVYGTLALRSLVNRRTLRAWLKLPVLRVCDLNLRPPFDYLAEDVTEFIGCADILKINRDEARRLVPNSEAGTNPAEHAAAIAARFGCPVVCITLGRDGALLWTKDRTYTAPSPDVTVRDTIGAGDAFTAALLAGRLACGDKAPDWQRLIERACALGAFVSGHDGAQPTYTIPDVPGFV